jgi:hypothetical protein
MCGSLGLPRTRPSLTALGLSLAALAALPGCDLELGNIFDTPPTDCAAAAARPWVVGWREGDQELVAGDSYRESVTPGLPTECAGWVHTVTWSVGDPSVASVTPVRQRNAANDTAGDIARAWVTGLAPGVTTVNARVQLAEGVRESQPRVLRVVAAETPSRRSVVVAEGSVTMTFNPYTGSGGSGLIPVTVPRDGRLDISVDWTSFTSSMAFFLREGACSASPCPGRLVVNGQIRNTKPHRESADVTVGEYTFWISGSGSGEDTASYELRLTPH